MAKTKKQRAIAAVVDAKAALEANVRKVASNLADSEDDVNLFTVAATVSALQSEIDNYANTVRNARLALVFDQLDGDGVEALYDLMKMESGTQHVAQFARAELVRRQRS